MKNLILTLIAVSTWQLAHCQTNLIKNYSFELKDSCHADTTDAGQLETALYWINPTDASPDYFNECFSYAPYPPLPPILGVPANQFGWQSAKFGENRMNCS